ncbi:MAG: hypothetical protein LKM31_00075 [Sphingobium sp.]|nr:hypothetical protein [Sphingobium sp.]
MLIVATVGIGLGALLASVRGSGMGLVAFGFQMLIGVGLFVGWSPPRARSMSTTGSVTPISRSAACPPDRAGGGCDQHDGASTGGDDRRQHPRSHAKLEFGAGGHSFDLFLNAVSRAAR